MENLAQLATSEIRVSFGDCDPAGIVFYPNYFRWTDALFHLFLDAKAGGHAKLCKDIGALGIGLMAVEMSFRSPVQPGQTLELRLEGLEWQQNRLTLSYTGHVGDRLSFRAIETRGVFKQENGLMRTDTTQLLRNKLG